MIIQSILRRASILGLSVCSVVSFMGCEQPKKELAPKVAELAPEKLSSQSLVFEVDSEATKIIFEMDAELEHISGRAPASAQGSLSVSPNDITKTSGLVKIDLLKLSLFQKKREEASSEFGEEVKSERQNEHMRTWLQISEDGPEAERKKNRFVEFKLERVSTKGAVNLLAVKGGERRISLEIEGSVRLHGRVTKHKFQAEAVFTFEGDKAVSLRVTSKSPLKIDLEKHDVRPRSAFNILADKTLAAMGSKVAKIAEVSIDLSASLR